MSTVHILHDAESGPQTFDCGFTAPVNIPGDQKKPSEDVVIYQQTEAKVGSNKLYALVNGFRNGRKVSSFVAAELSRILCDDYLSDIQPTEDFTEFDNTVKTLIDDAFTNANESYYARIGSDLAQYFKARTDAEDHILEAVERMREIENEISGGAVGALALLLNRRLYVANCGNSRVVLIQQGADLNNLKAFQATELHESHDTDEIQRLQKLGIDPMNIEGASRCFGDYFRNRGYTYNPELKAASSEPIIVKPAIKGGIEIDDTYCFLLFLSPSLCQAILKIETGKKLIEYIAQVFINKVNDTSTIEGAVQAVLEFVSDELKMKVESQHCKVPDDGLSMMYVPLNHNVLDLIKPVDGNEKEIKTLSSSSDSVDSYVDFPDYFADTDEARDLRSLIEARVDSIKTHYLQKNFPGKGLPPISED